MLLGCQHQHAPFYRDRLLVGGGKKREVILSKPSRINRYFFEQSNAFHDEIISLHDFILPTATALWSFRHTVNADIVSFRRGEWGDPTDTLVKALAKKYNTAPNTRDSTNLLVAFSDISWESQRERLAEVCLVNIIAIFESWCEEICQLFGRKKLATKLQNPTNPTRSDGVGYVIDQITASQHSAITGSIYPTLIQSKKYSLPTLDSLLKCFRYFKELRNCYMHRGRKCDDRLFASQKQFKAVANKKALGMSFVPEYSIFKIGDPIDVSLHGVLGFTDVILRMVSTIDAELSRTIVAEKIIVARITSAAKLPIKGRSIPIMVSTFGMQGVILTPELMNVLKREKIVE